MSHCDKTVPSMFGAVPSCPQWKRPHCSHSSDAIITENCTISVIFCVCHIQQYGTLIKTYAKLSNLAMEFMKWLKLPSTGGYNLALCQFLSGSTTSNFGTHPSKVVCILHILCRAEMMKWQQKSWLG